MSKFKIVIFVSGLALLISAILFFVLPMTYEPRISIGPDTSVIEGPLREDGFVDYIRAIDQESHEGIRADRNVAVALLTIMGDEYLPSLNDKEYCRKLGLPYPPPSPVYVAPRLVPGFSDLNDNLDCDCNTVALGPWKTDDFPLAVQWLKANSKTFEASKQLLECDQFYVPRSGWDDDMSSVVHKFGELAHLFRTRAYQAVADGNWEQCAADLLVVKKLVSWYGIGYPSSNTVVGPAKFMFDAEISLMQRAEFDSKRCLLRMKELELDPIKPPFAEAADRLSRFYYLDTLNSLIQTGEYFENHDPDIVQSISKSEFRGCDVNKIARSINFRVDEMTRILSIEDPRTRWTELEKFEVALNNRVERKSNVLLFMLGGRKYRTFELDKKLTKTFGIASETRWLCAVKSECELIERLLRTGWALKAFHLDHQRYPKTLAELVPHYVQEVPVDTVDGNPLSYKGGNNVCILKANTRYIDSEVSLFGPATTVRIGGVGLVLQRRVGV